MDTIDYSLTDTVERRLTNQMANAAAHDLTRPFALVLMAVAAAGIDRDAFLDALAGVCDGCGVSDEEI